MRRGARWLLILMGVAGALLFVRSSIAGVFRVAGPSDAPTLLLREIVLVNLAAYDLRLPGVKHPIARWGEPARGDIVLFRVPQRGGIGLKRVVAVTGDTVETLGPRLIVNGDTAAVIALDRAAFGGIPSENRLGDRVAIERLATYEHTITWESGGGPAPGDGPVVVPAEHVFVLGDNRDASFDSRSFGTLPRSRIIGRLLASLQRPR